MIVKPVLQDIFAVNDIPILAYTNLRRGQSFLHLKLSFVAYNYYWESLLLPSQFSTLSDSYQETESAFHPTFFPLASRGKNL